MYAIERCDRPVPKDGLSASFLDLQTVSNSVLTSASMPFTESWATMDKASGLPRISACKSVRLVEVAPTTIQARPKDGNCEPPAYNALHIKRPASVIYRVTDATSLDIVIIPSTISGVEYMCKLLDHIEALRRTPAFSCKVTFDKRGWALSAIGVASKTPMSGARMGRMTSMTAQMSFMHCSIVCASAGPSASSAPLLTPVHDLITRPATVA